jgi:hypothetical protein
MVTYDSLDEMVANASIILLGTSTTQTIIADSDWGKVSDPNPPPIKSEPLPETRTSVKVLKVLKGDLIAGSSVDQRSPSMPDVCQSGVPPVTVGRSYLFFLSKSLDGNGYWSLGGEQLGRYLVTDGMILRSERRDPYAAASRAIDKRTVDDVTAAIAALVGGR